MASLGLIFHVASLLVFVALGIWIANQARSLKLWRDWNTPDAESRIVVGEPVRVLRRLAGALDAAFESDVGDGHCPPTRISLQSAFELHKLAHIERISVKKAPQVRVCFFLRRKPDIMTVDSATLSRELGVELVIQ